jgi:hypothetical protein
VKKILYVAAMSWMSEYSIALCTNFTKGQSRAPMYSTHGAPSDVLEVEAAQLPRGTATKNETSDAV